MQMHVIHTDRWVSSHELNLMVSDFRKVHDMSRTSNSNVGKIMNNHDENAQDTAENKWLGWCSVDEHIFKHMDNKSTSDFL